MLMLKIPFSNASARVLNPCDVSPLPVRLSFIVGRMPVQPGVFRPKAERKLTEGVGTKPE